VSKEWVYFLCLMAVFGAAAFVDKLFGGLIGDLAAHVGRNAKLWIFRRRPLLVENFDVAQTGRSRGRNITLHGNIALRNEWNISVLIKSIIIKVDGLDIQTDWTGESPGMIGPLGGGIFEFHRDIPWPNHERIEVEVSFTDNFGCQYSRRRNIKLDL